MQQIIQRRSATNNGPTAKFAMNRLNFGVSEKPNDPLSSPPYEFSQENDAYNIYFNMYGIPESDIRIGLDPKLNSFTVFAQREKRNFTDQYLWVFALPSTAEVESLKTFYNKGVVQFMFPKRMAVSA